MNVLGVDVSVVDYEVLFERLLVKAKKKEFLSVAPVAVHPLTVAMFDSEYREVLNAIDCVVADSFWHRWMVSFLHGKRVSRKYYGPKLMKDLCFEGSERGLNLYFYGGADELVLRELKEVLVQSGIEEVRIFLFEASFAIDQEEVKEVANKANKLGKGILFVGIGSPKQHFILEWARGMFKGPVVGVGAAFDLVSGREKQCPVWVRRVGFEWLFRLLQNPMRLWKRYVVSMLVLPPVVCWDKVCDIVGLNKNSKRKR